MTAATIEHGRTRLVDLTPLPAPKTRGGGGYSGVPMSDGRVMLFTPAGEPCGIAASAARATETLRLLNR